MSQFSFIYICSSSSFIYLYIYKEDCWLHSPNCHLSLLFLIYHLPNTSLWLSHTQTNITQVIHDGEWHFFIYIRAWFRSVPSFILSFDGNICCGCQIGTYIPSPSLSLSLGSPFYITDIFGSCRYCCCFLCTNWLDSFCVLSATTRSLSNIWLLLLLFFHFSILIIISIIRHHKRALMDGTV